MARWIPLAAALAAALVVGLVVVHPFLRKDRLLPASNPQPAPLFETVLIPLKASQEACMTNATIDEHSEVAYARIGTRKQPAQPIALTLTGEGYRWQARHPPTYTDSGIVTFQVEPPAAPREVRICLRNEGDRAVDLYAANDRTRTRVDTFVDEEHVAPNFDLWFTERYEHSFARRSPTMAERVATFRPAGAWLPWTLIVLFLGGLPLALAVALHRAGAHDEGPGR